MIEHPFTRRELARAIAYRDILRDKKLIEAEEREKLANNAFRRLALANPFDGALRKASLRGKLLIQFRDMDCDLIARVVAKNIRSNCRVEQSNRRVIVRNLITFLREGCPYYVFRFDIKSFFESVDRKAIISRLLTETSVPRQAVIILDKLFQELAKLGVQGIPRGLGISSVLAEYVLEHFDSAIRSHPEIFFYGRFVDDIVLITSNRMTRDTVTELVDSKLPKPLSVHSQGGKLAAINIGGISKGGANARPFSYLGYSFTVYSTTVPGFLDVPARRVDVEICEEKQAKMKSRVINSFVSYLNSPQTPDDQRLLKDRIKALTGNYEIADPATKIPIRTGIFYNYSEKNVFEPCSLLTLDGFMRGLLFSRSHPLSIRIQMALSDHERRAIAGFTFSGGFEKRRFHYFDYKRLKNIKGAWRK